MCIKAFMVSKTTPHSYGNFILLEDVLYLFFSLIMRGENNFILCLVVLAVTTGQRQRGLMLNKVVG